MEGSERCFLSDVPFLSVFLSDVPFLRIRCNWPLVAVLGGSGLDSGFLEFLGLDSDFRGPPELGSGLLEPLGWILSPWDLLGCPLQMAISDFHYLQFLTSFHQRLINTEFIIRCCVVAGATSKLASAFA